MILVPAKMKGPKGEDAEHRIDELLDRVGFDAQSNSYPNQLFDGQQQHVVAARALAMGPHAMLFDEVTNALGLKLVGEVLNVIHDLADEGIAMFVITHEVGFAREVSDRTVLMVDDEVVEDPPPEVFSEGPKIDHGKQFLSELL